MEIQITSLKKTYGNKAALDSVTFSIGNGMFGLVGRNGAGKTTLMQILATLSKPSGGQVTFDGIPLEDTKKIRSFIGYLPQEFSLYPDMSVQEVMRYLAALSELVIIFEVYMCACGSIFPIGAYAVRALAACAVLGFAGLLCASVAKNTVAGYLGAFCFYLVVQAGASDSVFKPVTNGIHPLLILSLCGAGAAIILFCKPAY